jgi:Mrp family chromosome partitioning ATPase/LPS O-antigen subunit length determinant protein (WzzB/FepE family)
MMHTEEPESLNRDRIWPVLWRSRYTILASIVVMIGLSIVYTLQQAKVYQATAILEVNLESSSPGSQDTTSANQGLAQDYATLITSSGFLGQIRPHVDGGKFSVSDLQGKLSASALPTSALVRLQATGSSPEQAQRIAEDVATGFLSNLQATATSRTSRLQTQVEGQISQLTDRIATLSAQGAPTEQVDSLKASRQALISQNATLIANGLAQGTSATLPSAPQASSTPISPKKSLNLIAGLVLGLVLGVGLAWARNSLQPAIHSADDVTSLIDAPVLASVPLRPRLKSDDPILLEAYRVLYASLSVALRSGDMRVITFAGYNPQVGKTSTVIGLARVAAGGNRQILMVDGDMRLATLSQRLGYGGRPGLVDVLQHAIPLDQALIPVDDDVWLLPTRTSRVNAASLLAGHSTSALLEELRDRFDLILIDSPPLSGLADGLILASESDVVVLVVRAGLTKPADIQAAAQALEQNASPIAGTVVFETVPMEPYYAPEAIQPVEPTPSR